jgi:glycosyltransferase involved in cell wall biosynthesis
MMTIKSVVLSKFFKLFSLFLCLNINFLASPILAQAPKIVGLMAVRNEAQIIANSLQALALYTDAIVVLDDASTDNTVAVIKSLQTQCCIAQIIEKESWYRDEPGDRNKLLAAGRAVGGTHFIMIDADEIFTANLLENNLLKNKILALKPGDKMTVTWINLWRSPDAYRYDSSVWSGGEVDAIFCDDGKCGYDSAFIHSPRSPANLMGTKYDLVLDHNSFDFLNNFLKNTKRELVGGDIGQKKARNNLQVQRCLRDLIENRGMNSDQAVNACLYCFLFKPDSRFGCYRRDFTAGLMHSQFVNWENLLIKQAWYRCLEKIRNSDIDIAKINKTYGESKSEIDLRVLPTPENWFKGYDNLIDKTVYQKAKSLYKPQVLQWFALYSSAYFKELDIWDINWS